MARAFGTSVRSTVAAPAARRSALPDKGVLSAGSMGTGYGTRVLGSSMRSTVTEPAARRSAPAGQGLLSAGFSACWECPWGQASPAC